MARSQVVSRTSTGRKGEWGPRPFPFRGFSLLEALLTLLVLSLVLFTALRLVDRSTRIAPEGPVRLDLTVALNRAVDALTRDLANAGAGGLPAAEGLRPLRDNSPGQVFLDTTGETTIVRVGTDQVAVRGVLRTPLLTLDAIDRSSGRPFSAPVDGGLIGEIQRTPDEAVLRIYAYPLLFNPRKTWVASSAFPGAGGRRWLPAGSPASPEAVAGVANDGLEAIASRLREAPGSRRAKSFFLVADRDGRFAVARVLSMDDRTLASGCTCTAPSDAPGDCPPGGSGCFLTLRLDFTDADAVAFHRGAGAAPLALGSLASGGVFDEIVYFVARGSPGRPPDYSSVSDPPSTAYPHPYLAAARSAGRGRYEISRVAEDIEEFQVAWALASGSGVTWRAERPDSPPPLPAELDDSLGRPLLKAIKIALVAKSATRRKQGAAGEMTAPPALNAPPPDPAGQGAAPVGWALDPRRRVSYERESRVVTVIPRNFTGETVR